MTVPDRDPAAALPLSFMEETLWRMAQQFPLYRAYNVMLATRLRGPLDLDALERSFETVARRHDTLRTAYAGEQGRPRRLVASDPMTRVTLVDGGGGLPVPSAADLATTEFSAPFDLATAPLFRSVVVRLGDDDHVLLVPMHHVISDAQSVGILTRELAACYSAHRQNRQPALPPLPIRYADFAVLQRETMTDERLDRLVTYWKDHLRGLPGRLRLPVDAARRSAGPVRGAGVRLAVGAGTVAALGNFARRRRVTLFAVLLAAFSVLLHRLSGDDDLIVAVPISDRGRPELEALIGVFLNFLVLRTDASGRPTFEELVRRTFDEWRSAYAHRDLPHLMLRDAVGAPAGADTPPLYQVMFNLVSGPPMRADLDGLSAEPFAFTGQPPMRLDLALTLREGEQGLHGLLLYHPELFTAETATAVAQRFSALADEIAAAPAEPIDTYLASI